MSPPIGHIRNHAATKAAKAAHISGAGIMTRAPENFPALDAALTEMRVAGVRRIIIEGGDGTVREIISRTALWPEQPEFAIIAAGNTNLIARSAGEIEAGAANRLRTDPAAFRSRTIPLLKVERKGLPDLSGFIMGAGAYTAATRLAQQEIGARHGAQVVLAVLRLLRSPELRAPSMIGMNGEPEARLLLAMTTLPGALIFGLSPFWGEAQGRYAGLISRQARPGSSSPHLSLPLAARGAGCGRPIAAGERNGSPCGWRLLSSWMVRNLNPVKTGYFMSLRRKVPGFSPSDGSTKGR